MNSIDKLRVLAVAMATMLVSPLAGAGEMEAGAEVPANADRLRVGLVLGGGGARGAAHIGVLQELERMRVPVDAIVGTSIGAVVGGLYASGMTPDEIQELISRREWIDSLDDTPNRSGFSYRRKQDDEDFPIGLELGLRGGKLQLPQGVIQGQNLELLLRKLTIGVSNVTDFDKLGIPFRALTTDLVTGKPHVLRYGDLALAIRASMSVPGAIAPVPLDGRLLADGGLAGNLGVAAMQAMDVDVIIAVDVAFPLYRREQLTSAIAISEQVLTILIHNETQRQIELLSPEDILLRPDLGDFASTNLQGSTAALEPGVEAARASADRIRRLALDEVGYARHVASRRKGSLSGEILDFVRVVDQDGEHVPQLERQMQVKPGDPIDANRLSAEANRLYGLRAFEKVGYLLVDERGRTGVEFTASSNTWGRNFLKFGIAIEDDFEGSTAFNFSSRLWRPGVNRLGGEWRADVRLGTLPLLATELYQPLSLDSRLFVAPSARLSQRNIDVFDADRRLARLRVSEARAALDVGASLGNWGEFRIGAFRGDGNATVKLGDPGVSNRSFDIGGVSTRLTFDTFDHAQFPRSGTRGEIRWDLSRRGLGASDDFEIVAVDVNTAWSRGKSTLVAGVDFATSTGADDVVQAYFPLGGFLRLSGLERGRLSGPHAGVLRALYYRRIGSSAGGLTEMPVYVGMSLEAGNAWSSRDDIKLESLSTNASVFFGLDTYLGPMFLAAGLAEGGGTNFYLFIGALPD